MKRRYTTMLTHSHKYEPLLTIIFSVLLGVLVYYINRYNISLPNEHWTFYNELEIFLTIIVVYLSMGLGLKVFYKKLRQNNNRKEGSLFKVSYWLLIVFTLLINYLIIIYLKFRLDIPNPFKLDTDGMRYYIITVIPQLIIVAQIYINYYYQKQVLLIQTNAQLEKATIEAKYQALQNQLYPHFLFNNLNTLISEIKYNPSNATNFTQNLADVYRYLLQFNDIKLISLSKELDFIKSYLFLHEVRIGSAFTFTINIPNSYLDLKLPPLSLQLIVENVFKHNTINKLNPMSIKIFIDDKYIVVQNPIIPKQNVLSTGKGLLNLISRYKLFTNHEVIILEKDNLFTIKIPLISYE